MKTLSLVLLAFFFVGCSQDQMQAALGNPKHTCTYKTKVLATIRNDSNHDVPAHFCSSSGPVYSLDQVVPADHDGHTYELGTYEKQESFYDSAAESCADKGMQDRSLVNNSLLLSGTDPQNFKVCHNLYGRSEAPVSMYREEYVVAETSSACPSGFEPYVQSPSNCH